MTAFALEAYRGDTIRLQITCTREGAAVNLTGASIWFTGKKNPNDADADAVFQKTLASGAIVAASPANGIAVVTLATSDTSSLPDTTTLYCDCQVTESSGLKTTVAAGTLRILADQTRA